MDCLGTADIKRYVQGTMSDREADAVTKHLVACKRCRQVVAEMRGTTDPRRGLHEMPTVEKKPSMIKVQCDKCSARYGIPEERVRGRMLKIRCKNCSNIIEVVGAEPGGAPGVIKSVIDRGRKHWFLVVKRQRVGPMTEQEVRERFERGEIKPKTYAWRQGFSKWERLSGIPEFKDLADAAQRTPSITRKGRVPVDGDPDRTEKARPPRAYVGPIEPGSSEELDFDRASSLARTAYLPEEGGTDSAVRTAYVPGGGSPPADGQVTHVHMAQRDPLAGLDASDPETAEAQFDAQSEEAWAGELQDPYQEPPRVDPRLHSGEWDQHMKGQRHDDSVLFSLGHLRKLAGAPTEKGRVASQSGSTGLFDIRPMAGPPASALLMPEEPGSRKSGIGLVLAVALLGVVVGAGVLLGVLYLVQPSLVTALLRGEKVEDTETPGTRVAVAPAMDQGVRTPSVPTTEAIPVDAGSPDTARPPDAAAPVAEQTARREVDERERPAKAAPARARRKPKRRRPAGGIEVVDPDKGKAAPPPAPVEPVIPPAPEPKPKPKDRKTELDELIDGATGPERSKPAPRPQKKPDEDGAEGDAPKVPGLPRTLTREQVAAGMKRAEPFVRLCYKQYGEPGVVTLSATIDGAAGRISQARVVGAFAGTPTGACVIDAVKRVALFPRFSGPPLTLKYPYMLR